MATTPMPNSPVGSPHLLGDASARFRGSSKSKTAGMCLPILDLPKFITTPFPETTAETDARHSLLQQETLRIRKKYETREKERKVLMYQKALDEAILRERAAAAKKISFQIQFDTKFGQNMFMVGSDASLGCWTPSKAMPMVWTEGNIWICSVVPSPGSTSLDYKYILKDGDRVDWEDGNNHRINLTDPKTFSRVRFDTWGKGGLLN